MQSTHTYNRVHLHTVFQNYGYFYSAAAATAPTFYPLVMLGGFIWMVGNLPITILVRCIGLGIAILIWSSTNMVAGWASDRCIRIYLTFRHLENFTCIYIFNLFISLNAHKYKYPYVMLLLGATFNIFSLFIENLHCWTDLGCSALESRNLRTWCLTICRWFVQFCECSFLHSWSLSKIQL